MRKFFILAVMVIFVYPGIDAQENFLTAHKSLSTTVPIQGFYGAMDVINDLMYALDGDTVYTIDIENATVLNKMRVTDQDYSGFAAFLTINQQNHDIWVGYTTIGNTDDRIYKYDSDQEIWSHKATFPSNFDLAFRDGKALVSGLNSTNFEDPNGIWLLDESGANEHRMLVKIAGYSAGLDIDKEGNVFYATSMNSNNSLLKWSSSELDAVLESENDTLKIEAAEVLATLPAGAYDLDLDTTNNIIFNCNNFVENFIGIWDGGSAYDTLATSDQYITRITARGDLSVKIPGNQVFALAYGYYISEVHFEISSSLALANINNEIKVYPNPVQDDFRITSENTNKAYLILTDMNGRSILKQEYLNSNESVDVSFLVPGNYILTFMNNGLVHKTIIQKK